MKTPGQRDVVAFIQPFVPNYRKGLFDAIAARLSEEGLRLEVWHDQPKGIVAARGNATTGEWTRPIKQHRLTLRRKNLTFRNVMREARHVRAVVTGLASTNLETYLLAIDRRVNMMLWGHGKNFTAGQNAIDTRLEKILASRATHIFTYTERGAGHLTDSGVPNEKITVVRNSTDTVALRTHKANASAGHLANLVKDLGLTPSRVGLYVGAFDEPKRLPFLFEAADRIATQLPDFVLILAGAGPLDDYVFDQSRTRPYVRLLGRLEQPELAMLSNEVDVIMMPGRVGLVAVDALALGVPVATTEYAFHAPEADYLDSDNSLWTENDPGVYASEVVSLLRDAKRLTALKNQALHTGADLSVEASAEAFVAGILKGLGEAPRHPQSR